LVASIRLTQLFEDPHSFEKLFRELGKQSKHMFGAVQWGAAPI
jgi:hypothetical protein